MDRDRSSGKESYVSKRNVLEKDNIAEGNMISVKWGKTNKYYKAKVLGNSQETPLKETPKQPHLTETAKRAPKVSQGRRLPTDLFTFELGKGAVDVRSEEKSPSPCLSPTISMLPSPPCQCPHDKVIKQLKDICSEFEATVEGKFAVIEKKLDRLLEAHLRQEDRLAKVETFVVNLTESHVKNELDILLRTNKPVLEQNDVGGNSPAAFLDLTNSQSPTGVFQIPPGVISKCLEACRGRKNLAGRLAKQLFTEEERKESNCRCTRKKALGLYTSKRHKKYLPERVSDVPRRDQGECGKVR